MVELRREFVLSDGVAELPSERVAEIMAHNAVEERPQPVRTMPSVETIVIHDIAKFFHIIIFRQRPVRKTAEHAE